MVAATATIATGRFRPTAKHVATSLSVNSTARHARLNCVYQLQNAAPLLRIFVPPVQLKVVARRTLPSGECNPLAQRVAPVLLQLQLENPHQEVTPLLHLDHPILILLLLLLQRKNLCQVMVLTILFLFL